VTYYQFDASEPDPLERFDGLTRLFPLPNVVLFPGALLPLHVFEERYRAMVADAMDTDQLITMVLLKAGYEEDYEGSPEIHEIGCIGHVVHHELLDDGKSNLILRGLARVHIDSEEPHDQLYRIAQATILRDRYPPGGPDAVSAEVRRVTETMVEILKVVGREQDASKIATTDGVQPGAVCDLACHCLGFDVEVKQELLCESDVRRRAAILQAWMDELLRTIRRRAGLDGTRPDFSAN
jgi:Lon protease-like protein